jgi:hypothetical protein
MAIVRLTRIEPWEEAPRVRPVAGAAAAAPPPRPAAGAPAPDADEPIDVDVLWEELESALRSTPTLGLDPVPLAPSPAAVASAYAAAMRRPPRETRVDLAVV